MFLPQRRTFLKHAFLGGAVLILLNHKLFGAVSPKQTLDILQHDLFPLAETLGVDTVSYIDLILKHRYVTDDEKIYLRNGIQWLNEESVQLYKKSYVELEASSRQKVLHSVTTHDWGRDWLDTVLTYMMEAMSSDKVYGVNPHDALKLWLGFESGKRILKRRMREL